MFQSTRHSDDRDGFAPSASARSALVPPMSNVIVFSKPADWPTSAPPTTPPAGPEWQMRAGTRRAERAVITPPPECVTRIGPW